MAIFAKECQALRTNIRTLCSLHKHVSLIGSPVYSRSIATNTNASAAKFPGKIFRNVSFWGHIDAGKTTLTEKVIYLANALDSSTTQQIHKQSIKPAQQMPGDVDSGSTVTDFLEAERQRGITIQSAAVGPFVWRVTDGMEPLQAQITLVDTPGHIDFSIEVERSLRVADGCVVLIDGVEGVESQTEGVWKIAQRYNVRSHIAFVNKLDRTGASLSRSIQSIASKGLHSRPTLLQLPIFSKTTISTEESTLTGLIDLTSKSLQAYFYGGKAGERVTSKSLDDALSEGIISQELAQEARKAREHLIDTAAGLDELLLEEIFASDDAAGQPHEHIRSCQLRQAIRRLVHQGDILPVLCGSAQKGVGVQPVLDAICRYLPAPEEAGDFDAAESRQKLSGCVWGSVDLTKAAKTSKKGTELSRNNTSRGQTSISIDDPQVSMLAFKVVWDKRRGPLTYVRIYSGTLTRSCSLLNTTTQTRERLNKILFSYADQLIETDKLEPGQIGVLLGLKDTKTGDTLVDTRNSAARKVPWSSSANTLTLRKVNVPPPVFSLSVEPRGKSDEGPLFEALDMLIRTDPSLHVDYGDSSGLGPSSGGVGSIAASAGQMVLSGMGELHLEIAKDRLIKEFGGKAHFGPVRVSYRETIKAEEGQTATTVNHTLDREVMGQHLKASCRITISALSPNESLSASSDDRKDGNVVDIDLSGISAGVLDDLHDRHNEQHTSTGSIDDEDKRRALLSGILATLSRGPVSGNPIVGLKVHISDIKSFGPQLTPIKALTMLSAQALRHAIVDHGATLMEPIMHVNIHCDEDHLGRVVADLTSTQQAVVEEVNHQHHSQEGSMGAHNGEGYFYVPLSLESSDAALGLEESQRVGRINCRIIASVPLVRLVQYSSQLRALTRGNGTFEMKFKGFSVVSSEREREILMELGRL